MRSQTEEHLSKATFFQNWRQKTQGIKQQELKRADKCFLDLMESCFTDKTMEFSIDKFNQLNSSEQFEFIESTVLIGLTERFGMVGQRWFKEIGKYLPNILARFTADQRYALARIDMERKGTRVLKKYSLDAEREAELLSKAQQSVLALKPRITSEMVIDCLTKRDLNALQYHIFNRFSGYSPLRAENLRKELKAKLHDIGNECRQGSVHDETIQQFIESLNQLQDAQEYDALHYGWYTYPNSIKTRPSHWRHEKISGDTYVEFSHGGGFLHILKFLTKKTEGYRLERPGLGIQVSPGDRENSRDKFYSERSSSHFDYPARLSGTIRAKYLDSANNGYEAGLRSNFIDFIENIVITRLDTHASYQIGTVHNTAALHALQDIEPVTEHVDEGTSYSLNK